MTPHLHRRRRDAGNRPAVFLEDERHISQSENFRVLRQAEVGIHFHAAGLVEFHPELFGKRSGGHSRSPKNIPGANDFAAFQFDLAFANLLHARGSSHLHAELPQLPFSAGGQIFGQMRKNTRRTFEEDDAGPGRINPAKVAVQNRARKFSEGSGQFNARWPAANDDDGHQPFVIRLIERRFRLFKREQYLAANAQGVLQSFQPGRKSFPLGMTEVTGLTAEREHEVIVVQRGVRQKDLLVREVKIHNLVEQHRDVAAPGKNRADRLRNIGRGESSGGNLIKQGLKQVMVGAINQRDAGVGMVKFFAELKSAKTRAENHDMNLFAFRHGDNLSEAEEKAIGRKPRMDTNKHKSGTKQKPRLRLRVSPVAESNLRAGHPWLFGDSIREQNREGEAGELAVVYDRQDRFLAVGLFDPESPIRLRVLHAGKPLTIDSSWWKAQFAQAVERRSGLFDERTTGYRLINGESDGWPGLVLDRYDTTLVLKIYTAAWLPWLREMVELIQEHLKPERMVLRWSRNLESKFESHLALRGEGQDEGNRGASKVFGSALSGNVVFQESGIRFEADVLRGQKTGFFLDQRENRRRIESLAHSRMVLNAFSFSGGFSLYAARGGAASVTDLDISAHALESAKRNFALNHSDPAIAQCQYESRQADTFEWLGGNEKKKFDLIILDPPSFAKREADRAGAIRAYERLTALGLTHLKPNGILLSCSCSAHVSAEEFFGAVRQAAAKSGRRFQELETTRHAPDHHAAFKEAEYLKGIFLTVS